MSNQKYAKKAPSALAKKYIVIEPEFKIEMRGRQQINKTTGEYEQTGKPYLVIETSIKNKIILNLEDLKKLSKSLIEIDKVHNKE